MSSFGSAPPQAPAPSSQPWTPGGPQPAPREERATAAPAQPSRDTWSREQAPDSPPTDAPAAPPWSASAPASSRAADHDEAYDDYDDEPGRRLHPYTWLHILVLAVVAFVLGFLIMLLVIQARGGDEGPEAGAAAGQTVSVTAEHPVLS